MPHGARYGAGNALEFFAGHHHHRHAAVAAGTAEMGGHVCGGL
jgi:hypothetical protein